MVTSLPSLPQMPKMDWRTGGTPVHWSDPVARPQQRQSGGYTQQLPTELQSKPAFRTGIDNAFWDSVMGAESTKQLLDTFGASGVGKVWSGSGFGQFNAKQDQEIQAAAEKYGVPANFLKAIIAAESSGKVSDAQWISNNRPNSGGLLPYIGVYKNAADSRGMGHLWGQAVGNTAIQAEILAGVLRSQYDQLQKENSNYGWSNVANYHYSGQRVPNGWTDEFQNMSNNTYTAKVTNWWKDLDAKAGNQWNNYSSSKALPSTTGSIGRIGDIFGGSAPRISQEFGKTAFSQGAQGKAWYGYAAGLGVQGHAGIDYSMAPGGKLYSPVAGTVIRAGGSGYYTDERYGNRVGTGELRLKLDNGDELILGHMGSITPKVGQRVNAGDFVGLSGTYNGGHVHAEYRQYAPGKTSTNYLAIDPRKALVGGTAKAISQQVTQGLTQGVSPGMKQAYGIHGAGIEAARRAAGLTTAAEFAKLVNDSSFLKGRLELHHEGDGHNH